MYCCYLFCIVIWQPWHCGQSENCEKHQGYIKTVNDKEKHTNSEDRTRQLNCKKKIMKRSVDKYIHVRGQLLFNNQSGLFSLL